MKPLLLLCTLGVAFQPPADSKEPSPVSSSESCELWGRVIAPSSLLENLDIQLAGGGSKTHQKTHLVNGTFQFKPVPSGTYQLRVLGPSGHVIATLSPATESRGDHLWLHLPFYRPVPARANTVSLNQLHSRQIANGAIRAFRDGQKADEAGDVARSIDDFAKALALHPRFAEAAANLAIQYFRMGNQSMALQYAQAAYGLAPQDPGVGRLFVTLLLEARRYQDAEQVIRPLLGEQGDVAELHELLAISLIGEHGNVDEALAHLKLAAAEFPTARLLVATALAENNRVSLALLQVREFVRVSASPCERPLLEKWIKTVGKPRFDLALSH